MAFRSVTGQGDVLRRRLVGPFPAGLSVGLVVGECWSVWWGRGVGVGVEGGRVGRRVGRQAFTYRAYVSMLILFTRAHVLKDAHKKTNGLKQRHVLRG